MTLGEIGSLIAVFVSLYAILSQRGYTKAQTDAKNSETETGNAKTALELREEMRRDREAYRLENVDLKKQLDEFKALLETEAEKREEYQLDNAALKKQVDDFKILLDTAAEKQAKLENEMLMRDRVIMDMKNEITGLHRENNALRLENIALRKEIELLKGLEAKAS